MLGIGQAIVAPFGPFFRRHLFPRYSTARDFALQCSNAFVGHFFEFELKSVQRLRLFSNEHLHRFIRKFLAMHAQRDQFVRERNAGEFYAPALACLPPRRGNLDSLVEPENVGDWQKSKFAPTEPQNPSFGQKQCALRLAAKTGWAGANDFHVLRRGQLEIDLFEQFVRIAKVVETEMNKFRRLLRIVPFPGKAKWNGDQANHRDQNACARDRRCRLHVDATHDEDDQADAADHSGWHHRFGETAGPALASHHFLKAQGRAFGSSLCL
ncbi:MAG TPA: hypothetical protein VKS79_23490 [Gemmataceae bacterium]|nr:hypothetical protein [Gemmataceae bacterium]